MQSSELDCGLVGQWVRIQFKSLTSAVFTAVNIAINDRKITKKKKNPFIVTHVLANTNI